MKWLEKMRPQYAWDPKQCFEKESLGNRLGETGLRRVYGYRQGGTAHFAALDKVLRDLDLHLQDIPDELWRDKLDKTHKLDPSEVKRLWTEERKTTRQIAMVTGASQSGVQKIVRELGLR